MFSDNIFIRRPPVKNTIVAIDIGTSKICTVIAKVNNANQIEILGKGMCPSQGIKKGVIVDIESASKAIRNCIAQAEASSNLKVMSAYVNISRMHVDVLDTRNSLDISKQDREVSQKNVNDLLKKSSLLEIPENMQVIDVIPRQFIVDGYDGIVDPVGMAGTKLEIDCDIVLGKITSVQNILKSLEKINVKVDGFVVDAFSLSELLINPEEKDMGVLLIEIGACKTEVSAYKNNKMVFYEYLPIGGEHITNDISIGLKISYNEAERIKRQYELALTSLIKNDQEVFVTDMNDNKRKVIKVSQIVEIIEARVYEIFHLCRELLMKSNVSGVYNAGVILSGAGISYVDGAVQLVGEAFNMSARVSSYRALGVSKPEYAVVLGIVRYINNKGHSAAQNQVGSYSQKNRNKKEDFIKKVLKSIIKKIIKIINKIF